MIVVVCPGCHRRLQLADNAGGHEGKCAHCGRHVRLGASAVDLAQATNDTASNLAPETGSHPPSPPRTSAPGYEFLAPPERPDEIGRLGNYRVLELLGQGAMGMVFRAEDPGLGRILALKVMLPSVASVPENRERFRREAEATALVNHANVIPIYNIGVDRGVPFLAMPLLKGELLEARLNRERRLTIGDSVRFGREIAAGLAAAHERNLIHRDIKPANLWLEVSQRRNAPDRIKILDFGLARIGDAGLTSPGAVLGTPAYMSPEQAKGLPVDFRCDLFSLGCVFYRMLTGERAFQGNEVFAVLMALTTVHPPAPHEVNPAIPPALSHLVMHLLAKDPADRPQSAADVVEALNRMGLTSSSSSTDRMAIRGGSSGTLPAYASSSGTETKARPQSSEVKAVSDTRSGGGRSNHIKGWLALIVVLLLGLVAVWGRGLLGFKPQATVMIDVRPSDSEVFVDSKPVTLDSAGMTTLSLTPGSHDLKVRHKDYHGLNQRIEVAEGSNSPLIIKLEKLPAEGTAPEVPVQKNPKPKEGQRKEVPPKESVSTPSAPKNDVPKERDNVPNKAAEPKPPQTAPESKPPVKNPAANLPLKGPEPKSGKTTPSNVQQTPDGGEKPGRGAVGKPTKTPAIPEIDRRAIAEWLLARGARLNVKVAGAQSSQDVKSRSQIPEEPIRFQLLAVDLEDRPEINDAAVKKLVGLSELANLNLSGTSVTDDVVTTLAGFRSLENLYLNRTAISDAAVPRLKNFTWLKFLELQETKVSDGRVKELQAALKECKIRQ